MHALAPAGAGCADRCLHCDATLGAGAEAGFCCTGCRSVHELLQAEGLSRYYALGRGEIRTVAEAPRPHDLAWLEPIEARIAAGPPVCRVQLDMQGVHCTACVWLVEELFRRQPGSVSAEVNPALGRVELSIEKGFALPAFVAEVERFGYRLGPPTKGVEPRSGDLLMRMGVTVALAMNAMMFALAIYLGLSSGPVYDVMRGVGWALSALATWIGGTVFVRSAWQGLRRGVLHLDTPIALGIVLGFVGTTWAALSGRAEIWFEPLTSFIALMLVGRWLQERVLEKNRRELLADDGVESLLARRIDEDGVSLVRTGDLREGDELLVAPGDLVPTDARLLDAEGAFSLEWIHGESAPLAARGGDTLPAGALNASSRAVRVRLVSPFAASPIVSLLRAPVDREADVGRASPWWQVFARTYSVWVIAAATLGFIGWWLGTGDPMRAGEVATAVLVVTCPCAFGIAVPLAYELTQAGLRRRGLFVRTQGLLDRLLAVRRVVFDKTGTLTTGRLELVDASPLAALDSIELRALRELAIRSAHPKSAAVARALPTGPLDTRVTCTEHPGLGLEATLEEHDYRLGAPAWCGDSSDAGADVVFTADGVVRARFFTREVPRPDAASELSALVARGYEPWILSGDTNEAVQQMAARLGVPGAHAVGAQSPEDKARWLGTHDHRDTLFLGDGINDSLAISRAFCAGTPAIDRPFLPSRADFYLVSPGLGPIALAFRAAAALRRSVRRNLCVAIAYNLVFVSLSLAGLMTPVIATIAMPLSSLFALAMTTHSLGRRSALWTS